MLAWGSVREGREEKEMEEEEKLKDFIFFVSPDVWFFFFKNTVHRVIDWLPPPWPASPFLFSLVRVQWAAQW